MADLQFNITAVFEQASVAFRQLADDLDTVKKKVDELNAAKGEVSVDDKGIDQAKAKVTELKADVEDLGRARATPEVDPKGIDETKAKVEEVSVDYDALDKKKATPEVDPKGAEPAKLSLDQIFDKMDRLKGERAEPEVDPKVEPAKISLDDIKARIEALKNERADPEITVKTGKAEEQLGAFANKMRVDIQAAIKSLPEVDLTMKLDATEFETKIQEIRGELAAMQNLVVKGTFDDAEFLAKLHELEAELQAIDTKGLTVRAQFDVATAMAQLAAFRAEVAKKTDLEVGTDKANAEIGAFATGVKTKIEAAIKSLPDIHITADSTQAEQRMAAVKALLESLKDKRIGIDIDRARFDASMTVINAELTALSGKNIDIPVRVDADSARTALKGIGSDLDEAKGKVTSFSSAIDSFAGVMSTRMGLIGGSIQPLLASIGQLSGALGLLPAIATAVGTGFAAVKVGTEGVSQAIQNFSKIEDLATKATDASAKAQQANATATQASTAAGTGNVAALKQQVTQGQANVDSLKAQGSATAAQKAAIAGAQQQLFGYEAALKNAQVANTGNTSAQNTSTAATKAAQQATTQANSAQNAYNKALEAYKVSLGNLAPAAQSFVMALAGMNQTFKDLKLDVQQHLFEGLATTLQSLSSGVLPTIRTGLTQMADAINTAVKNVASFVTQQSSVTAWREIFTNVATAATNLAGAIKPILQIITDVTQVGSQFLPGLASGFANAAQAAADFVSKAKDTGQLAQWIQTGITAVGQLWDAFKNVVAIIADLAAAPGFSPSFLATLDAVTSGIRWITDNVPAATTVVNLFFTAWVFAKVLSGITGMVTSIGGMGLAIDGLVAKLAALTGGEIAAGAAGTTAAAGFTGMLGPLGALALAITVMVTHWDVVVQGFKDMGAVAMGAANDLIGAAKAIGDALTGDFGAAQRALDDTSAKHKALMQQLSDHTGWDSAKTGADGLKTSLGGLGSSVTSLGQAQTAQASANNAYNSALTALTQSVQANGTSLDANTKAGQANITAVNNLVTAAQALDAADVKAGQTQAQLVTSHNAHVTALKTELTQLGLNTTAVNTIIAAYEKASSQPDKTLNITVDPSGAITGANTAQAAADGVHAPPPIRFLADTSAAQAQIQGLSSTVNAVPGISTPKELVFAARTFPVVTQVQSMVDSVNSIVKGVQQPPVAQFKGDASDVTAKAGSAQTATQSVTPQHNTTFIGAIDDINNKANSVTSLIGGVVQSWLTSFFGDSSGTTSAAAAAQSAINGVSPTHQTTFTGDGANLLSAAAGGQTAIQGVVPDWLTKFAGDTADLISKASTSADSINNVPSTHGSTFTGDSSGLTAAATASTSAITAVPTDHSTAINAVDNATSVINSIISALASIPTQITTTVTTVYQSVGGAGGMIATPMAAGGVIEMASGGELSPNMSGSVAKMIPPNTWRVVGDRMVDDEAFIPINNSAASLAILGEAATRMGHTLAPMHRGGYWHHGGGGGTPTPPPVPAQSTVPIYEIGSHYATSNVNLGVGRTAAITKMVSGYQATGSYSTGNVELAPTTSGGSGTPPPVHVHCHFDALGLGDFESSFMTWLRKNVRVQGGDVQRVLG